MGFEPEFFVMAAGFVEFCLAFLLIVGRFSSQVAAGALFSLLILAMPAVGLIDAIGHLPLVIVLALLAGTENSIPMANGAEKSNMMANSIVGFTVCVPGVTSAYYLAHEFAYRGQGITDWVAILAFTPLISLFVLMAVWRLRDRRLTFALTAS